MNPMAVMLVILPILLFGAAVATFEAGKCGTVEEKKEMDGMAVVLLLLAVSFTLICGGFRPLAWLLR
jgi:hypothetical protein